MLSAKFKCGCHRCERCQRFVPSPKEPHDEISNTLKQVYPGEKRFRLRTFRRFCLNNNIVRNRITTDELEERVRTLTAVKQVSSRTINSVVINMDRLRYFPNCTQKYFNSQLFRYIYFVVTG